MVTHHGDTVDKTEDMEKHSVAPLGRGTKIVGLYEMYLEKKGVIVFSCISRWIMGTCCRNKYETHREDKCCLHYIKLSLH